MAVREEDAIIPAPAQLSRVSWGAIFAGAVSAVALTALLSLLGLGIGFGTLDPAQGDTLVDVPKVTLAWWAVTSIVATGVGGFIAARLAGIPHSLTGALHGLAVWAVATLIALWLATTAVGTVLGAATSVVSTTARVASGAVTTAGGAIVDVGGAVAPSPSDREVAAVRDRVRQEAVDIGRSAGVNQQDVQEAQNALAATAEDIARTPGDLSADLQQLIDRLFEGPDAVLSPTERNRLVDEIAARSGVSRQEAEQIASRWQTQANAAAAQARTTGSEVATTAGDTALEASDQALSALSKVAWGMFLISLAGLVAAVLGAALGAPGFGLVATSATLRDDEYRE